jgi:hypothetical protein
MSMLMPGDQFPDMEIALPGGNSLSLPGELNGSWAYVMFYRGGW